VIIRPHLVLDAALAGLTLSLGVAWGPGLPFVALGAGTVALHAWATVSPRASFYLRAHWQLPEGETGCALTFDDGPHPEHTPAVLDLLAAHGARATFFVIGAHVRRHGALLRRIRAEGHTLGLHSDGHSRWFNCWPSNLVRADLERCQQAVADATGEAPPVLFRPPVGLKNPLVADAVRDLDLVMVTWSARTWDTSGARAERIADRLRHAARPRAIVLLHDGHEPAHVGSRAATVAALALALPQLAATSRALTHDGVGGIRVAELPAAALAR
jgi:peptidoglycan/xylan/chitin deacetylase (PgdA/CDA1 family)